MGAGVTSLALATSLAGAANAAPTSISPSAGGSAAGVIGTNAKTCFSNLEGDSGEGNPSQNFESIFKVFDAKLADDVTIGNKACTVTSITAIGHYSADGGPADSVNVWIYKDKRGEPGKVVSSQTVSGTDDAGNFVLPLEAVKLEKKTTYWVTVQVNLNFYSHGQWYWQNTTNGIGDPALFKNPGDGFGTGCTDWGNAQDCFDGDTPGPDYMFKLGKE